MSHIRGRYAIVGRGEADVGRRPDTTAMGLHFEAITRAIEDAGIVKSEIDGIFARSTRSEPQMNYSAVLAARMGLQPNYVCDVALGGASSVTMVLNAVAALEAGLCSMALCVNGESQFSRREQRKHGRLTEWSEDFENPFGFIGAPVGYGLAARRHMHEYGTTSRQFGAIAVACRKHASLNPNAMMRKPITIEDHQNSRLIADPFRLLDCCIRSDAAGAVIVTSVGRARDLRQPPVYLLGMGQANTHQEVQYADCLTTVASQRASKRAFAMAGLGPADVDFVETYDCFTYVPLVTIEDYGFCKKGEGGSFVENGRIELGGELPLNLGGGLLSQGHSSGMLHVTEAVTQLRNQAGQRQVRGAEVGIVGGQCGTLGIHATLLLAREAN